MEQDFVFLLGADFIGLSLVIVYVGAIAVLFLFVVMMLDGYKSSEIKDKEEKWVAHMDGWEVPSASYFSASSWGLRFSGSHHQGLI